MSDADQLIIDARLSRTLDRIANAHLCDDCGGQTLDYIGPNGGALCDACAEARGLEVELAREKRAAAEAERRAKAANPPMPVDRLSALEERIRKLERRVWELEGATGRMR